MLRVSGIDVGYGPIRVLSDVSLEVREGEIVALVGSNGAGKTTTLKTIAGLLRPRAGRVEFAGRDIGGLPPSAIVRFGIATVPEGRRIFPRLTVMENLRLGAFARRDRKAADAELERVFALFPRLRERAGQLGETLSGGEQQMLAFGRALMSGPKLLLLDEPSMGLAPVVVQTIFATIRELNRQGMTILLVEQNANAALRAAHRGYVLETGRIVLSGPASELLGNEQVRRAYLGVG